MIAPKVTSIVETKFKLPITLISFGVKSGKPFPKADCYLDVRGAADPSFAVAGNGDDPAVQKYVMGFSSITPYLEVISEHLRRLTSRRGEGNEYNKPFVVCCMCAHGIHRSRAMKHILASMLRNNGWQQVEVG